MRGLRESLALLVRLRGSVFVTTSKTSRCMTSGWIIRLDSAASAMPRSEDSEISGRGGKPAESCGAHRFYFGFMCREHRDAPLRPVSQSVRQLLHEPSTGNESHRLKMRWLHWLAERLARVYSGCSGDRWQCRVSGRTCIGTGQPLVWTDLDGSSCWQTEGASPDRATNRLTSAEIPSKLTCWTHNWTGPALAS